MSGAGFPWPALCHCARPALPRAAPFPLPGTPAPRADPSKQSALLPDHWPFSSPLLDSSRSGLESHRCQPVARTVHRQLRTHWCVPHFTTFIYFLIGVTSKRKAFTNTHRTHVEAQNGVEMNLCRVGREIQTRPYHYRPWPIRRAIVAPKYIKKGQHRKNIDPASNPRLFNCHTKFRFLFLLFTFL